MSSIGYDEYPSSEGSSNYGSEGAVVDGPWWVDEVQTAYDMLLRGDVADGLDVLADLLSSYNLDEEYGDDDDWDEWYDES